MDRLNRTVVLVGMMGAGKSSVGRRLATRLSVPFRDADSEIESAAGCTISDIFARFGEAEFRHGERRVIARLLDDAPHVLATGGGAFCDAETRARIKDGALSIWIRAPIDILLSRVGRRDTRPLLRDGDPRAILERLLAEREPLYGQADMVVDSEDGPHHASVEKIVAALQARGVLEAA
ncbi:MAG TPA: shikimate kinase [Rhizomicrobium sp.]|jgi:shikimate kinase|nr:shikimate kinase [Rhizomicrobium sp.]